MISFYQLEDLRFTKLHNVMLNETHCMRLRSRYQDTFTNHYHDVIAKAQIE